MICNLRDCGSHIHEELTMKIRTKTRAGRLCDVQRLCA
jgi:hypothetical protein